MKSVQELDEEQLMKISLWSAVAFSIVGIGVGVWTHSQMVLFDGMYSFVSVLLSSFSFFAIGFINKEDPKAYPFGKGSIEPIVVIVKYIVLTLLIVQSFFSALMVLRSGGRIIPFGAGFFYSFLSTVGCYIVYDVLKKNNTQDPSPLIDAEKNQWAVDALISLGVFSGFLLTLILQHFEWVASFVPYADSAMVLLVTATFMPVPIKEIRYALRQLVGKKPKDEAFPRLEKKVQAIREEYEMADAVIRFTRAGRTLRLEIDFLVSETTPIESIAQQDSIRQEIADVLEETGTLWLTISFTEQRKWVF